MPATSADFDRGLRASALSGSGGGGWSGEPKNSACTAADGGDPTWHPQFPYYDPAHFVSGFCSPGGLDFYAINLGTTPGTNTLIGADCSSLPCTLSEGSWVGRVGISGPAT